MPGFRGRVARRFPFCQPGAVRAVRMSWMLMFGTLPRSPDVSYRWLNISPSNSIDPHPL
jgi:hypothetical protein